MNLNEIQYFDIRHLYGSKQFQQSIISKLLSFP